MRYKFKNRQENSTKSLSLINEIILQFFLRSDSKPRLQQIRPIKLM